MAEDLRSLNQFPAFHNFSAAVTTTEILLPSTAKYITAGSSSKAIYICRNGATDGGAIPTHRAFVPASNYLKLSLSRGLERVSSVFVAVQSGTGEISIILEE